MENKENIVMTQDVFCTSCGTKNNSKSNFCLNCGHELKKVINTNKTNINNNSSSNQQSRVSFKDEDEENKGFFRRGIISKVVGLMSVLYFVYVTGVEEENFSFLLIMVVLGILYFNYPTMKKIINVALDVIGKLVLAYFIFILLLIGACFFLLS